MKKVTGLRQPEARDSWILFIKLYFKEVGKCRKISFGLQKLCDTVVLFLKMKSQQGSDSFSKVLEDSLDRGGQFGALSICSLSFLRRGVFTLASAGTTLLRSVTSSCSHEQGL